MIPGGPTFGVTKRLQKWPRYFANKALQRGAETDASSIEVRDTAYRTQAATKRTREDLSMAENCTVTRRSSAHWQAMSEGSKHVCSINCCIRSWLEIFPPVRLDDTDLYLDWLVKLSKFLGV